MADFMQNKIKNPKIEQCEIANQIFYSSSTLKRYGKNINKL